MPASVSCLYARLRPARSEAPSLLNDNPPDNPTRSSSAETRRATGDNVPCRKRRQLSRLSVPASGFTSATGTPAAPISDRSVSRRVWIVNCAGIGPIRCGRQSPAGAALRPSLHPPAVVSPSTTRPASAAMSAASSLVLSVAGIAITVPTGDRCSSRSDRSTSHRMPRVTALRVNGETPAHGRAVSTSMRKCNTSDADRFTVSVELARTIRGDRDSAPGRRHRNRTRSRTTGNEQWAAAGTSQPRVAGWLSAEWT